jgi:5-methylthioadenosine/S-adenosylhomocysteine deaminase
MKILLKDFDAITLGEPPVRKGVAISIEDGVITQVAESPPKGRFDRVLSGQQQLVIPGLINAHTHLAMVLMRGYADDLPLMRWLKEEIWPLEAQLTAEEVYWGSLLGIAEMFRSGTTCFADMYFHMDAVAQAVEESGIRALLAYGIIAPESGARADRELRITEDFIERHHETAQGRIRTAVGPHAPYTCHPCIWQRSVELVAKHDVLIHTHLAETQDEVQHARTTWGKTPVEYLKSLGVFDATVFAAHCVHVTEKDIEILAEHDVRVVHNPTSNLKLGSGFAPIHKLLNAGITVAIGTDGASSNNNLDVLEEIRLAALAQKGILGEATALPAVEALKLATACAACALRWEELGTIDVGKRADLVILDVNRPHWVPNYDPVSNLVYAAQAADVRTVIIDGRIVMEDRVILTFDEEQAKAQVRRFQERHYRRR